VAGRLEEEETGRTNAGGRRKNKEKKGEKACARKEEGEKLKNMRQREKEEGGSGGCGPAVGLHPNKPLVTRHLCHVTNRVTWHMCHVTIGLIKKQF
jgi:hypothetical protein